MAKIPRRAFLQKATTAAVASLAVPLAYNNCARLESAKFRSVEDSSLLPPLSEPLPNPVAQRPPAPDVALPNWLQGVPFNKIIEIPNTILAGSPGAPLDDPANFFCESNNCVRAYCGMGFKEDTSEIFIAAAGGHRDGSDNSVRSIAIGTNSPVWRLRSAATPAQARQDDVAYYLDGKPSSRHTYWSTHWIQQRQRLMLFGSRFVWGRAVSFPDVNGFNPATNLWDPDNAWTDGFSVCCRETATGNCWAVGSRGALFRWTPQSDTWVQTGTMTNSLPMPIAHDPKFDRLFSLAWGDGQASGSGITASIVTNGGSTQVSITFNQSSALNQLIADQPSYAAMEYDPENELFVFFSAQPGASNHFYLIKPNASLVWDISLLQLELGSILPQDAGLGGLLNKFRYVPALKGFVFMTSAVNNLYFIRIA